MTKPRLSQAAALAVTALTVAIAAGCTTSTSHPTTPGGTGTSSGYVLPNPGVRARVSILQLVLDTGQPTDQPLDPHLVANGVVVYNAEFQAWFGTGGNGVLSSSSRTSLRDEAVKAQAFIDRVPSLPPTQAAHAVIASELLDAGLITQADLPGAVDSSGAVTAGSAVESWYTAHAAQLLSKSSSITLSSEADRIVAEIEKQTS